MAIPEDMREVYIDKNPGHIYASVRRLTHRYDANRWWIKCFLLDHWRVIVMMPMIDRGEHRHPGMADLPLPTHHVKVVAREDGTIDSYMIPIDPLLWSLDGACPANGDVIWRMDDRARDPVVCWCERCTITGGVTYRFTTMAAHYTQPEIVEKELAVSLLMGAAGIQADL